MYIQIITGLHLCIRLHKRLCDRSHVLTIITIASMHLHTPRHTGTRMLRGMPTCAHKRTRGTRSTRGTRMHTCTHAYMHTCTLSIGMQAHGQTGVHCVHTCVARIRACTYADIHTTHMTRYPLHSTQQTLHAALYT